MAPCERSRGPARVPLCPRAAATRLRRSCGLLRCAAHASRLAPLASGGAPSPPLPSGLGLRGPPAPTGFRPPPRRGNTPALPWQGARPLTRRLRPPLPRLRGCVAVWGCARVVRLRARGLAGGCAGSPPSGPLRGVAWALHGGGLGGRPLGRPFGRVAPPAVLRVGLCLFPAFVVSFPFCVLPLAPARPLGPRCFAAARLSPRARCLPRASPWDSPFPCSPPFWSSHCSALSRTAAAAARAVKGR